MDVEKAMELLRVIMSRATPGASNYRDAESALRALDGEGEEEWEAVTPPSALYLLEGFPILKRGGGALPVAVCALSATARRIADDHNRIGRLERAARGVVVAYDQASLGPRCIETLRAALKQEGQ